MATRIPEIDELHLWPHQVEAVKTITTYIRSFRRGHTEKAALVQMPTGSGKSGVIAVLARCTRGVNLTLVLTPRKSLCKQLYNDISGRFFRHIEYNPESLPKEIQHVTKGANLRLETKSSDQVLVMTIQMLVQLHRVGDELFQRIMRETSLLVVDEGHYEPAVEWSQTIRAIRAPKVIFTATPYRNDFKIFDIDPDKSFVYSHSQATEERFLRKVEVIPRVKTGHPAPFIEDIIAFYDEMFADVDGDPPRVIIRCDDRASIRQLAEELQNRNKTVLGIHETFRFFGGEAWERRYVPDFDDESAIFWIHQFKLMEGIDDPRFQMLAFYQKVKSARSLVQQVGRIIRNPAQTVGAVGYLLDHWSGHHGELWQTFVDYDNVIEEEGLQAIKVAISDNILTGFIAQQPRLGYYEGRFRRKFEFDDIDPLSDIQLPLRANLIEKNEDFNLDEAVEVLVSCYQEKDRHVAKFDLGARTKVVLSIRSSNSSFLRNHSFIEADLHVSVLREFDEHISLYDSSGQSLTGIIQTGLGGSVDVKKLKRLFHTDDIGKLTSVSLSNSNIGTSSIRSRTITASSISNTIPGFDDYAQICTTAEGYSQDQAGSVYGEGVARRYVGFSRGRVAQSANGYVTLPNYLTWMDRIGNILAGDEPSLEVLSRYALHVDPPDEDVANPRNILLDMSDIIEIYFLRINPEEGIEIEDVCADVIEGEFTLTANGATVSAGIKYIKTTGRYQITSPDLDSKYVKSEGEAGPDSLVSYLNRSQSFRVLPDDPSRVYVQGQFYKPAMKIGDDFDASKYPLGNSMVDVDDIGRCGSEKGKEGYYATHVDDWDPDSLFGIISRLGEGSQVRDHFGNPDILICDDTGTEIADFIICTSNGSIPRVIFIHAKARVLARNRNPRCSASGLHEVCAQAVKNLGYMAMFNDHKPSKLDSWDGEWKGKISKTYTATVDHRICLGDGDPSELWEKFRATINNPMVDKQVWLFTGNLLSRKYFEEELGSDAPQPHVVQAAYLLHATMSDVASVGAKLKIFCAE